MDIIFKSIHFIQFYLLPFIVVIGVMIFFHELGHFLVAKYCGVKVLKFALGFGPILVKKIVGETEYSIRYFPLGGFVKMLGEDIGDTTEEDLPPDESERSFSNQHVLKRISIVAAGPIFNLLLALFVFCILYIVSGTYIWPPEIDQVTEDSPAYKAGFLKGDIIVSIDDREINRWEEVKDYVQDKAGIPLTFGVNRNDEYFQIKVTPKEDIIKDEFGQDIKASLIGIRVSEKLIKIDLTPWQAIKEGFKETIEWIRLVFVIIGKLFQGVVSIKALGGPILIGQMTGQIAQQNIGDLIRFVAIISINLGILNLFPIPILDGGLIVFLLIELCVGKPLGIKQREFAQKIGLALLLALMILVTYNDIVRLFQ